MKEAEIKQLIGYIKKLVEAEVETRVESAVKTTIGKLIKEGKISTTTKTVAAPTSTFKNMMENKTAKPKSKKVPAFSKDPSMNKILQETFEQGNWKNMGNFTSDVAAGWNSQMAGAYSDMTMETNVDESGEDFGAPDMMDLYTDKYGNKINQPKQAQTKTNNINDIIPDDMKGRINTDALPDFLQKALTKNYADDF